MPIVWKVKWIHNKIVPFIWKRNNSHHSRTVSLDVHECTGCEVRGLCNGRAVLTSSLLQTENGSCIGDGSVSKGSAVGASFESRQRRPKEGGLRGRAALLPAAAGARGRGRTPRKGFSFSCPFQERLAQPGSRAGRAGMPFWGSVCAEEGRRGSGYGPGIPAPGGARARRPSRHRRARAPTAAGAGPCSASPRSERNSSLGKNWLLSYF